MYIYEILSAHACLFVDKKTGEKVKYYRILIRSTSGGGDFVTLEKATEEGYNRATSVLGCSCRVYYDAKGRICGFDPVM